MTATSLWAIRCDHRGCPAYYQDLLAIRGPRPSSLRELRAYAATRGWAVGEAPTSDYCPDHDPWPRHDPPAPTLPDPRMVTERDGIGVWPLLALLTAMMIGLFLLAGCSSHDQPPPGGCVAAIAAAEDMFDVYEQVLVIDSHALIGAVDGDAAVIDDATAALDALPDMAPLYDQFHVGAADCRAGVTR